MKNIEAGPSESELRRRNLIEMLVLSEFLYVFDLTHCHFYSDADELEDRLYRLQKASLKSISDCTGWSKFQRAQKVVLKLFCLALK